MIPPLPAEFWYLLIFVVGYVEVSGSDADLWITSFSTSFLVFPEPCLRYLIVLRNCFRDGRIVFPFCLASHVLLHCRNKVKHWNHV